MKDINIIATFTNSDRVLNFKLSSIIVLMGSQCAEDVPLSEEIGEDMAYLADNLATAKFEVSV